MRSAQRRLHDEGTGGIEILSPKGRRGLGERQYHAVTRKRMGNIKPWKSCSPEGQLNPYDPGPGRRCQAGDQDLRIRQEDADQGRNQSAKRLISYHSGRLIVNISGCITLTGNPDLAVSASWTPDPAQRRNQSDLHHQDREQGRGPLAGLPGRFLCQRRQPTSLSRCDHRPGRDRNRQPHLETACPGTVKIIHRPWPGQCGSGQGQQRLGETALHKLIEPILARRRFSGSPGR